MKKEIKCPDRWMQKVMGSSRELFLVTLGHIPWNNCPYALEIARSVRPHAFQKHKIVLCHLLISQKALVTLVKKKKKRKKVGLAVLALLSPSVEFAQNIQAPFSALWSNTSARPSIYSLPALSLPSKDNRREWGLNAAVK